MNKIRINILVIVVLSLLLVTKSALTEMYDKYKVVDGDSLEYGKTRIRLIDIDAPELFQKCYDENNKSYECGKRATEVLKSYVERGIICKKVAIDKYKRSLMECFDRKNENINQKMVLSGWAVAYGNKFRKEEKNAKDKSRGIWKGRFMRPELYRALHKN